MSAGNLPPGPKSPRLWQLIQMATRPFDFVSQCTREYGDVFTLRLLGQEPFVYLGDAEAIRWVFSQPRTTFTHVYDMLGAVIGERSLIYMEGDEHRAVRHMLMPALHGERMRSFGVIMGEVVRRESAKWPQRGAVTVRPGLERISLEVICRCIFGSTEGPRLEHLMDTVIEYLQAVLTPSLYVASSIFRASEFVLCFSARVTCHRCSVCLPSSYA